MDRYDYINLITDNLRGSTGMNFQQRIGSVLKEYFSYKQRTFEMPSSLGGDKKNDGWVVEEALFYQIYAPSSNIQSQKKDVYKKFSEDLRGLLNNIYRKGLWNGTIRTFIYLINTIDRPLPEDSGRYYEKEVRKLQEEFKVVFEYKVVNLEYIYDILCDVEDLNILEKISAKLKVHSMLDYNAVDERSMIQLIMKISNNISRKFLTEGKESNTEYVRVSSAEKIVINDLEEKRKDIEQIISNLDVVENAIRNINQDILFENKFERVKDYIIEKYKELCKTLHGVDLYNRLLKDMINYADFEDIDNTGVEFLIVYIFDKCDIFEKER